MPWPSIKAIMSSLMVVRSSGVGDINKSRLREHCMTFAHEPASAGAGGFRITRSAALTVGLLFFEASHKRGLGSEPGRMVDPEIGSLTLSPLRWSVFPRSI